MKKKLLSVLLALALILSFSLVMAAPAGAATGGTVTFEFHASDFLNVYPDNFASQPVGTDRYDGQLNARQLRDRTPDPDWQYNTFSGQESYNAYLNWLTGLGANEGISAFNMWLLDEPVGKAWGETIVSKPDTLITATCPVGWNYQIVESPYGLVGNLIEWYTTDPAYYLRPGEDPGVFSFSADVYRDIGDLKWDVNDPPVEVGDICRIWFGSAVYDDPPFHSGFVFDNLGWGTLTPATVSPGVFASSDYEAGGVYGGQLLQFDATLDLEATGSTVVFTATPPAEEIGISVAPSAIDFGAIESGATVTGAPLTVTNVGNALVEVSAELLTDTKYDSIPFYTEALKLNDIFSEGEVLVTLFGSWTATGLGLESLAVGGSSPVTTGLVCPSYIRPGISYTGTVLFVATAVE